MELVFNRPALTETLRSDARSGRLVHIVAHHINVSRLRTAKGIANEQSQFARELLLCLLRCHGLLEIPNVIQGRREVSHPAISVEPRRVEQMKHIGHRFHDWILEHTKPCAFPDNRGHRAPIRINVNPANRAVLVEIHDAAAIISNTVSLDVLNPRLALKIHFDRERISIPNRAHDVQPRLLRERDG